MYTERMHMAMLTSKLLEKTTSINMDRVTGDDVGMGKDIEEARQILNELETENELMEHLNKYYVKKHGYPVAVVAQGNMLGESNFRVVTFTDGYRATFCKRDESVGGWFRNERHVSRGYPISRR